jgi:ATP-dependent DNA ligase
LAIVERRGYRLVNRHRADMTDSYPELGFLNDLPAGIVLDGEVVVLRQGKPDFSLLLSRNQARASLKIQSMDVPGNLRRLRSALSPVRIATGPAPAGAPAAAGDGGAGLR